MVSFLNEWMVAEYGELLKDQDGVVLLDLQTLSVEETQNMRNTVRGTGAKLRLAKSRLAKVAFREIGIDIPDGAFGGTCAMLVGSAEETISATKAMEELWKKAKERKFNYRAAYLDGSVLDATGAARIPSMPDKQTLRGMLAGCIIGPARMLAQVLQELPASTARVIKARADGGDAA
ncbi:MAG TPA: 50S ribosomal protein L10 [Planctomycetota bacterium]